MIDHVRPVVEVEITVPDLADWRIRHRALDWAHSIEDEFGITVRCLFREKRRTLNLCPRDFCEKLHGHDGRCDP